MKKIVALMLVLLVALSVSACSGKAQALPDNLDGRWVYEEDGVSFETYISDERIQIYLTISEAEGLYWEGDFVMPEENDGEELVVKSMGNTLAMDASLFGSTGGAKTFLYSDGALHFDFTMVGVTKTIKLKSANV